MPSDCPDRAWHLAGPGGASCALPLVRLPVRPHDVSQAPGGVARPHPDRVRCLDGREEYSSPEGSAASDRDDASPLEPDAAVPPSPEVQQPSPNRERSSGSPHNLDQKQVRTPAADESLFPVQRGSARHAGDGECSARTIMSLEAAGTALGTSSTTIAGSCGQLRGLVRDRRGDSGCFNAAVVNRHPPADPCQVRGDCRQRGGCGGLGSRPIPDPASSTDRLVRPASCRAASSSHPRRRAAPSRRSVPGDHGPSGRICDRRSNVRASLLTGFPAGPKVLNRAGASSIC
jgi:hypothetical protein